MSAPTGVNLREEALVPGCREFTVYGKHQPIREFAGKRDRYKVKETRVSRSIGTKRQSPHNQKDILSITFSVGNLS